MAGKRRRSGAARDPLAERPYRYDHEDRIVRNRSALLDAINGHYAAALDRLPVEEMPALIPRLLKAGLCAGFSDPVSNIVVNTLSYKRLPERKPMVLGRPVDGKTAARRRRSALSRIVADTSDVTWHSPNHSRLRDMRMPLRSLEALVAFLVACFPYLPTWEALQYLRLANADLLAAARLVEEDRNTKAFILASRTTKTALRCAQSRRGNPSPERSSTGLAGVTAPQFLQNKVKQPPFVRTKSLKNIVVDKIYGLYLQVLAKMPREFLQRRYHRGLLKAGHCYGPFMNPAHNIVLNTVWYDTMFPAEEEYSEVAMICSRTLVSTACRSLLGLVAYLRACFPTVSRQQAIRYLLLAEVNLQRAIEMAGQEGHAMKDKFDRGIGFKAAATAAHHPDRDALVNFYLSAFFGPLPLKACGSFDVQLLSLMLSQEPSTSPHCSFETVPVLTEGASRLLSNIKQDFEAEQNFICSKVNAALKKYTQRTKGPEYDLHVICGLNPYVIKSGVSPLHYGDSSCKIRYKSKYSHVNFLASPRGSHSSDTVIPTLFFAECCNDNDITDEPLCWPIMGHPGRCFHCEYEGVKVVHPESQKYHGRDIDFEEMACKSHSNGIVNEDLVSSGESVTYSVGISQEDCIYFDFRRDVKCANFLNAHARMLEQRHCF
ncbi:hypothetical protein OsJ_12215 [Oryza sativa Japonica Group]|uniref:Uncharacterized protein n=1 Tax=Oryza sativa subsp. japonica TaxID=39947 RepID=B9FAR4_ORYSJ|nr:hypothetical protein OsJ_12215 [Oryza sativa Japonica Group]